VRWCPLVCWWSSSSRLSLRPRWLIIKRFESPRRVHMFCVSDRRQISVCLRRPVAPVGFRRPLFVLLPRRNNWRKASAGSAPSARWQCRGMSGTRVSAGKDFSWLDWARRYINGACRRRRRCNTDACELHQNMRVTSTAVGLF
jgi:hypothetical protein